MKQPRRTAFQTLVTRVLPGILLLFTFSARAATVTGSLIDLTGSSLDMDINFRSMNPPGASGIYVVVPSAKKVTSSAGTFTVSLLQGNYQVSSDRLNGYITVPAGSSTYNIKDLFAHFVSFLDDSGVTVSDEAFAADWDGVTTVAPSKNAIYDWSLLFNLTESGYTDVTTANATTGHHGLLPKLSGNASQGLKGDGTWGSVTSNPGGSDTQNQFNDGGVFAGNAASTFNKSTGKTTLNKLNVLYSSEHSITNATGSGITFDLRGAPELLTTNVSNQTITLTSPEGSQGGDWLIRLTGDGTHTLSFVAPGGYTLQARWGTFTSPPRVGITEYYFHQAGSIIYYDTVCPLTVADLPSQTSGSSILKGNGSGGFANAVSNTDYAPVASPTFTGTPDITQAVKFSGDISPSQITSNQNDYNPTGLSTASVLRLSTDASRDVTGLAGGADGRAIFLYNVGAQNLVLKNQSSSSSAANRFALNADLTIGADQGIALLYDSTSSRWRARGGLGTGSGGTTVYVNGSSVSNPNFKNSYNSKIATAAVTNLTVVLPDAVTLTDAATVATDASQGVLFRVTLGGNRTLGNPTNPTDGQLAWWEIIQDGTGSRTLTLDTKWALGTTITDVTLSTTASKRDFMQALYNSTADKWYIVRFVRGY